MTKLYHPAVRAPRLLSLIAASFFSSHTIAVPLQGGPEDTSADALELSSYQHFVVYPHLEKALKAQQQGDENTALGEFNHAHDQAPNNVPLTLYLSEAYRHFGHNAQAQELLTRQLAQHPNDKRLEKALEAIPTQEPYANTLSELLALQQKCEANPSYRCRGQIGQNALRLGHVDIARQQLTVSNEFLNSPQGRRLFEDTLQRAVFLQQWQTADELWELRNQQRPLTSAEQRQWFDLLIVGQLDSRIEALQQQGIFNANSYKLAYASSLAQRNERRKLQHYLEQNSPIFTSPDEEKSWLYLLSCCSSSPNTALASYPIQFTQNRRYIAGILLPIDLREKNYTAAQTILKTIPDNDMLAERYALSEMTANTQDTLRLSRLMYQQHPNLDRLDQLTWQLIQKNAPKEATRLLLQSFPYKGHDDAVSARLLSRLVKELDAHPHWATNAQLARLSMPLATPQLRDVQRQLPSIKRNCTQIRTLLGDMSADYSADAWAQLAGCYNDNAPGMALYAYQQAERRSPAAYYKKASAYQAYKVHDYAYAMAAWESINAADLTNQDVMAVAHTAHAIGNTAARDHWLAVAQSRGLDNSEPYWWLHSQRYVPQQPRSALSDLNKALSCTVHPSAQTYISRAAVYHSLGQPQQAIEDLQKALALEPDNTSTLIALGYAYAENGDAAQSRTVFDKIQRSSPDNIEINKQLTYTSVQLGDLSSTQKYAQAVVDSFNQTAQSRQLTPTENQQRFDFRRLHEDSARRWTFNIDSTLGLSSGAISHTSNGNTNAKQQYRSYMQFEAEYRAGHSVLVNGDLLSVYGRLPMDTSDSGAVFPSAQPMLEAGVRWKPLRNRIFFVALAQQAPLDHQHGEYESLIRASASFLNGGKFSDEWHPNGTGWAAQNLYIDGAEYMRHDTRAWTADYRFSYHNKVAANQTLEPYAHVQANGSSGQDHVTRGSHMGGIGIKWNIWTGENRYNAWPHKITMGAEYQYTFKNINQSTDKRNGVFVTFGVHW